MPSTHDVDPKYPHPEVEYQPDNPPPEWAQPLALIALWLVIIVPIVACVLLGVPW